MAENINNKQISDVSCIKNEYEDIDDDGAEDDVFHFETEHLALRGNQSYTNLLRTIAILQAQRIRVHKQIEDLETARNTYLTNPQLLLEKLSKNEPLISPNYLSIVNLPELPELTEVPEEAKAEEQPVVPQDPLVKLDMGRAPSQLWTNDEQRRLERLLIEYPPEEVEMRRFTKIAKALGNRTVQQVFSRVQKYFLKLHEAGMPVPGRLPKYRRQASNVRTKFNGRRSTFFPAQNIEISMPEDEYALDELTPVPAASTTPPIKVEPKTEPDVPDTESRRKKLLQLKILTAIHEEKLLTEEGYSPDPLAPRCADCEESEVTRSQWRCNSCYCNINLCGDCLADQLTTQRFEHLAHDVVMDQET